jgi:hypothetical protein
MYSRHSANKAQRGSALVAAAGRRTGFIKGNGMTAFICFGVIVPQKSALACAQTKKAAEAAFCNEATSLLAHLRFGTDGAEFLAEFIHATCGIDDFVLAGVEGMRFRGNLDLHQRVFCAFEVDGFTRLNGRTGDELEVVGDIVKHDLAVIWVYASFHDLP